ncbi:MAG: lamin tail domain-containing protein [Archangium sp.]|nr:lamin tail domain-containing protein [Archangium sp.]
MRLRIGLTAFIALAACTEVKAPPPPDAPKILSLTVDRAQVGPGELVTISFRTQGATGIQVLDDSGQALELSGTVEEGSAQVAPARTTFYVARLEGAGGRDAAFVQVAVGEPLREVFLLPVPAEIESGESVQLLWGAPGASSASLKTGDGAPAALTGTTGTVTVSPARSERFTLSAALGGSPAVTAFAEVRVRPQLLTLGLDTPTGLTAGADITVRWTTRGAQRLVVREQHFGQLADITDPAQLDDGNAAWTVPATLPTGLPVLDGVPLRFLVTVSSNAGELSQELVGVVGDAPVIERVTAPTAASSGQNFLLAWNTLGATKVGVEVSGQLVFETQPNEVARAAAGSVSLPAPAALTTYTVVATNDRGVSVRQSVMVRPALLPTITSFTLMPTVISAPGETVTARWMTANTRRLQLRLENGPTIAIDSAQLTNGSLNLVAGSGQTLVLEAYNEAEEKVTATQTLRLVGTPAASVAPSPTLRNSTATLSWALDALGVSEVVGLATPAPAPITGSTRFVDLAADPAATEVLFADRANGSAEVRLPAGFRFPFLGVERSSLWVSTNGFIAVAAPAALNINADLSTASVPTLLAPYWDDLTLGPTAKVFAGFGPAASTGERTFIIQWNGVEIAGVTGTSLTFEVQLTETGQASFHYQTLTGVSGGSATVGVKEATQAVVQRFSYNGSTPLAEGMELVYFGGGPSTGTLALVATVSRSITFFGRTGLGLMPFSVPLVALGAGDLVVSEAMPSPEASVVGTGQWVELRNTQDTPIDLGGITLRSVGSTGGGFTFPSGIVIPSKGYLVVGQSISATANGGAGVTVVATDLPLDELGDTVTLLLGPEPISTLTWTSATQGRSVQVAEGLLVGPGGGTGPVCNNGTRTFGPNGAIGTPGQANETCSPYQIDRIPGGYIDLGTTGTEVLATASDYTGIGTVQLPQPFTYFGQPFSEIHLGMCGFLTFGTPLTAAYDVTNDVLPGTSAPNGVVALFWDRLVRNTNGRIMMRRDADRTIVSWQDFRLYATTSSMNFQVHLVDTGAIEFHYGTFTIAAANLARSRGSEATVWLESPTGGTAVSVGVNTDNTIEQNAGIRFTP